MKFPSLPRKGRSVQEDVTDIIHYLRSSRITNIIGGKLKTSANGTTIEVKPGKTTQTRGASAVTHPFKILNASNEVDGCRVMIVKGLITSVYGVGTNWPSNLWPTPDAVLYFPIASDTVYIVLKSTITGGEDPAVTAMVLETTTTLQEDTATIDYLVIGRVESEIVDEVRQITGIFQNIRSNLLHSLAYEGYSSPDYWRQLIGPIS